MGLNILKLYLPSTAEIQEEKNQIADGTIPYLLLAKALGVIQKQDRSDGTGKLAFWNFEN